MSPDGQKSRCRDQCVRQAAADGGHAVFVDETLRPPYRQDFFSPGKKAAGRYPLRSHFRDARRSSRRARPEILSVDVPPQIAEAAPQAEKLSPIAAIPVRV